MTPSPIAPFTELTARLSRELMTALVTEDDTDALARQVAGIAEQLTRAAAAPHAVTVEDPHTTPNHITGDITPASSARNPIAPPMSIVPDGDDYRCDLILPLQYQGPPAVCARRPPSLIDQYWASCELDAGSLTPPLTDAENYDAGTPVGEPLTVRGRIARVEGRKKFMEAEILCDDVVRVRAEGLWISPRET